MLYQYSEITGTDAAFFYVFKYSIGAAWCLENLSTLVKTVYAPVFNHSKQEKPTSIAQEH